MIFFRKNIKTKIFLIKVPIPILSLPAMLFSLFPNPLITVDQLRRFKVRVEYNTNNLTLEDLSINPISIETEMPKYLENF